MTPPQAIVFVLTPRLGDLHHRYLVPTTNPPDDQQVQDAFEDRQNDEARQKGEDRQPGQPGSEDVLAVERDVSQKNGRGGTEWLIVRDPRIRRLPAVRQAELRSRMQARLATLTLPVASEAAAASQCVPFQPIDDIRRWIDTELGPPITPTPQHRKWFMTIAILASGVMVAVGVVMMMPGPQRPPDPRRPEQTTSLATNLGFESEQKAVALLRERVVPDLRQDADLLSALNKVRPLIAGASDQDYKSDEEAIKDSRLKAAVEGLRENDVLAFLDNEGRQLLQGLDPKRVQQLWQCLKKWGDHERVIDGENAVFRSIQGAIADIAGDVRRSRVEMSKPHLERAIFVYEDSQNVAPILLNLFVTRRDVELTELGRRLSSGSQSPPKSLKDWLTKASEAYEGKRDKASLWFSKNQLKDFQVRAQDSNPSQGSDSDAGQFYAQLAELLDACRTAVSGDAPPPAGANAAHPAEQKTPPASPIPQPR